MPTARTLSPDEEYYLRNSNPFAPKTTLIGAPPAQVAPTYADLQKAIDWENTQRGRAANPLMSWGGTGPPPIGGGPITGTLPGGNPFSTLHNVKNPDLQSAIDSILSQVKGLSSDPNANPNVVRSNVKDPATAARIGAAGGRFDADVNDTRQSFSDFAKSFMAAQPQAQDLFNQESGAIGKVYDQGAGGLQAQLAAINNARQTAATQAAQRAISQAMARTNSGRILSGDSSYLDAILADAVGGIGAQTAKEGADISRSNLLGVTDLQSRLAGTRGNLLNQVLSRALFPIEARQRLAGNELSQLGGLSNLTNANTFFNLDSPEQMLARKLGLLGDVGRLDTSNNFYGLKKPYDPNLSGLQLPRYGGGSNGGFNYDLSDYLGGLLDTPGISPTGSMGTGAPNLGNTRARDLYTQQTGVMPQNDPNFSPELWQWAMQQSQPPTFRLSGRTPGEQNYLPLPFDTSDPEQFFAG